MTQLKVLICGGGIAGNALAFWLSKQGHDVTIVERFSSLRTSGLQIDLRGHGIEVLKRMGLEPAFRAKSIKEEGLAIVDGAGRQWAYFPANTSGSGPQSFSTAYEIMRGDLCRLMHDASQGRVQYVFGTTIDSLTDDGSSVDVRFADGKTERFDLVVGADGQSSRTRRMMLGPGVKDPFHPLGAYIAYFTIPRPLSAGERYAGTIYVAPGGRMLFTRRHNPHTVQGYVMCVTDAPRMKNCPKGDVAEEKSAIAEIFQGARWQTDWMVKSMVDADDFYCERLGVVKMDAWSSGRVALVGDAAYCPSATTGMGTTSALVGAYILAGEISKHCGRSAGEEGTKDDGLGTALKAYDEKFRPFMDQVQRGLSEESNPWKRLPSSPWGVVLINLVLAVVSFLRLDVFAQYFLREEVQNWDLPDYDEMVRA